MLTLKTCNLNSCNSSNLSFVITAMAYAITCTYMLTTPMQANATVTNVETAQGGSDYDSDGVLDSIDNCVLVDNPDQTDSDNDGLGNICDADLNNDCLVNFIDLSLFSDVFLSNSADADFNSDGSVNFLDLSIFTQFFPGPPGPGSVSSLCGNDISSVVVRDDMFVSTVDTLISGNVLDNDEQLDETSSFDAVLIGSPRYGELIGHDFFNGLPHHGAFDYQPSPGFAGVDSFAYRIDDGSTLSPVVTVYLIVGDVRLASSANWRLVLQSESFDNRSPFTVETSGTATEQALRLQPINSEGRFYLRFGNSALETWLPNAAGTLATVYNFNAELWQQFDIGMTEFGEWVITSAFTNRELGVANAEAGTPVTTFEATDNNPNQRWLVAGLGQTFAPTARPEHYILNANVMLTGNVISNDQANGFDMLALPVSQPRHGELVGVGGSIYGGITPWGQFDYQPDPGFIGRDDFVYQVFSSGSGVSSRFVMVTVDVLPQ